LSSPLLFAFGAMLCFGVGDLLYKRAATAGVPTHQFLMGQSWLFAPSAILLAIVRGVPVVPAALWGAGAGVCSFIAFYNFSRSLATGSISVNAPIFRMSFILTAALAVVILGEPLTPLKVAGLAAAPFAAWLMLGGAPAGQRISGASLLQVGVATAALGVAGFFYKMGLLHGARPELVVAAQACVFMPTATVFSTLREGGRVWPSRLTLRYGPAAGLALVVAFLLMIQALTEGQASVMVPIAQMGFVATAIFGFAFLGERFDGRKAAGLAIAAAAMICLALS
jgi:drug/metabolite transporter (DMT)-like permease